MCINEQQAGSWLWQGINVLCAATARLNQPAHSCSHKRHNCNKEHLSKKRDDCDVMNVPLLLDYTLPTAGLE